MIFANYILRDDTVYSQKTYPAYIKTPIVFKYRLQKKHKSKYHIKEFVNLFKNKFGITFDENMSLPSEHPLLVDIDWIMRANPYPPLLSEYSHYPVPDYVSFGYIDISGEYKQITYYHGEADTTPSLFVTKVRGSSTYYGDYFINYTVYLSKRTVKKPLITNMKTGEVVEWNPPPKIPKIEHIEWSSYAGASSNKFEELGFSLLATLIQTYLLYWFLILRKRKRYHSTNNISSVPKTS